MVSVLSKSFVLSFGKYVVAIVVPHFISSYDSRMFSFPDLCSIRKYNKRGEEYSLKHIKKACKDSHVVLFGSYPFDIDKKLLYGR